MSESLELEHPVPSFVAPSTNDLGLSLDPKWLLVANEKGTVVKLTQKQFDILSVLVLAYPESLSAAELRRRVWGDFRVVAKALDVHLFKLRRKLTPLGCLVRYGMDERYVLDRGIH